MSESYARKSGGGRSYQLRTAMNTTPCLGERLVRQQICHIRAKSARASRIIVQTAILSQPCMGSRLMVRMDRPPIVAQFPTRDRIAGESRAAGLGKVTRGTCTSHYRMLAENAQHVSASPLSGDLRPPPEWNCCSADRLTQARWNISKSTKTVRLRLTGLGSHDGISS